MRQQGFQGYVGNKERHLGQHRAGVLPCSLRNLGAFEHVQKGFQFRAGFLDFFGLQRQDVRDFRAGFLAQGFGFARIFIHDRDRRKKALRCGLAEHILVGLDAARALCHEDQGRQQDGKDENRGAREPFIAPGFALTLGNGISFKCCGAHSGRKL